MQNLQQLEYFIENILIVALSQTLGSTFEEELQSQNSFNFVNDVIKGIANFPESDEQCSTLDEIDLDIECNTGWIKWSQAIYDRATSKANMCTQGDTLNACFNVDVAEKIRKMLHYTPILTSVMLPFYKTGTVIATSSSVETEFSNIKNRVFKSELPLRVDKFILRHLDYLDGRIKEAMAKCTTLSLKKKRKKQFINPKDTKENVQEINFTDYIAIKDKIIKEIDIDSLHHQNYISEVSFNKAVTDKVKIEKVEIDLLSQSDDISKSDLVNDTITKYNIIEKEDDVDDDLNQQENWGGLNDESKKRRKPTYLDACPEWNVIQSHKTIIIPLLKNGNLCNSVRINNKYVSVKETCAFDALVQIIIHACGKEHRYKDELLVIEHPFIQLCINILNRGKITCADYIARAQILKNTNICEHSETRYAEFLNANCNVDHLIDIIFTNIMPSITRNSICQQCDYFKYQNFATLYININILLTEGLGKIQEAINDTMFHKIHKLCPKCNFTLKESYECSSHIILDTSLLTDPNYKIEYRASSNLDNITKLITIDDRNYILCGIINYISYEHNKSTINNRNGHYVAITYTGMHWYEYDDLKKTRSLVSPEKIVTPHTIMYIIKP